MKHRLQEQIIEILDRCPDMTIATVRPDGAPQATVVSFVHDGMLIYFGCGAHSQKAANIAGEPRVSLTVTPAYENWWSIRGLSIAAVAEEVTTKGELENVGKLMLQRFPQIRELEMPGEDAFKMFRLRPRIISVLDYGEGFGHTEMVSVDAGDVADSLDTMRHHWPIPAAAAG